MRDRDIIAEVTFFDRERRRNVIIPISADLDHRDIGAIVNQAIAQRAAHTPEFHRPAILAVEPRQIETDAPLEQMRAVDDGADSAAIAIRSEEHTSELQSLMRNSYAVFCLKKKNTNIYINTKLTTSIQT